MIMRVVIRDLVHFLKMARIRCNVRAQDVLIRIEVSRFENKILILDIERCLRRYVIPKDVVLFIDRKLWLLWPWRVRVFGNRGLEIERKKRKA